MSEVHTSRSGVIPNIFAGAFGAFLTAIIDSFTNGNASITNKFLAIYFPADNSAETQIMVALGVAFIGGIVCWIYRPSTRPDAFMKGLTIFAVLNIVNPFNGQGLYIDNHNNFDDVIEEEFGLYQAPSHNDSQVVNASFVIDQQQKVRSTQSKANFKPNATILRFGVNEWVSSIKPHTNISSIISEKVFYNQIKGERLAPKQRVQILESFSTRFKGYKYVKIRYQDKKNTIKEGWIKAGQRENWIFVKPDTVKAKSLNRQSA
jgi:hypothetical protein